MLLLVGIIKLGREWSFVVWLLNSRWQHWKLEKVSEDFIILNKDIEGFVNTDESMGVSIKVTNKTIYFIFLTWGTFLLDRE